MSVRRLDVLFAPRSAAIIGVSGREGNLGAKLLRLRPVLEPPL